MKAWAPILVIAVSLGLTATLVLAMRWYRMHSRIENFCTNHVQAQVLCPSHKTKAVVFTRDCGAAGYPHTAVAVLRTKDSIPQHKPPDGALIVSAWEGFCRVTVTWRDERTAVIEELGGGEIESSAPTHQLLKIVMDPSSGKIADVSPLAFLDAP